MESLESLKHNYSCEEKQILHYLDKFIPRLKFIDDLKSLEGEELDNDEKFKIYHRLQGKCTRVIREELHYFNQDNVEKLLLFMHMLTYKGYLIIEDEDEMIKKNIDVYDDNDVFLEEEGEKMEPIEIIRSVHKMLLEYEDMFCSGVTFIRNFIGQYLYEENNSAFLRVMDIMLMMAMNECRERMFNQPIND